MIQKALAFILMTAVPAFGDIELAFDGRADETFSDRQEFASYQMPVGSALIQPIKRVVAEGAFWVPTSLLPSESVRWEPVDDNTARAILSYGEFEQAIDITVCPDGQPKAVMIQRWSNENPEKISHLMVGIPLGIS